MKKSVDFFYTNCSDAKTTAQAVGERLGVDVAPLSDSSVALNPYALNHGNLAINPHKPFIIFNGDGYFHNSTLSVFKDLLEKRRGSSQTEISYIHVDGHDDIAPPSPENFEAYKSFVLGIDALNEGGVHILREGLTGEVDSGFISPDGPETWGKMTDTLRDKHAYVSVDIDVLDINALEHGEGIHHLFPQSPIGFDMLRLESSVKTLGQMACFVGADIVGFSSKGATAEETRQSYDNIARLAKCMIDHMVVPKNSEDSLR